MTFNRQKVVTLESIASQLDDLIDTQKDMNNQLYAMIEAQKNQLTVNAQTDTLKNQSEEVMNKIDEQKSTYASYKDTSRNQVDEITDMIDEQKKKSPYILLAVTAINAIGYFGGQLDLKDLTRKAKEAAILATSTEVAVGLAVVVAFFAIYKIFEVPTNKTT